MILKKRDYALKIDENVLSKLSNLLTNERDSNKGAKYISHNLLKSLDCIQIPKGKMS